VETVREASRLSQVLLATGQRPELGESIGHATELRGQHLLERLVGEPSGDRQPPVRHGGGHGQGALRAAEGRGVEQPGEGLVQVVQRYPPPVEGEGVRIDLTGRQLLAERASTRHAAEVAGAHRLLTPVEDVQHVLHALLQADIPGGRPELGARREVVPAHVTAEPVTLPVPVHGGRRLQARLAQVGRTEPVGIQGEDVADVGVLRGLERSVEEADGLEREGTHRCPGPG
jgi:hypothetical protein